MLRTKSLFGPGTFGSSQGCLGSVDVGSGLGGCSLKWGEDGLGSTGFPSCQEEAEAGEGWLRTQVSSGSPGIQV